MSDLICTFCGRAGHRASSCTARPLAAALLALVCATAGAAPVAVAPSALGGTVELHDTAGACVSPARHAQWVSADAKTRVPGCWEVSGADLVNVVFFDVSIAQFRTTQFTKPRSL